GRCACSSTPVLGLRCVPDTREAGCGIGFRLTLWRCGDTGNGSQGVEPGLAPVILLESPAATSRHGSCAGFADLFRYAVLCRDGGRWANCTGDRLARKPCQDCVARAAALTPSNIKKRRCRSSSQGGGDQSPNDIALSVCIGVGCFKRFNAVRLNS